MNFRLWLVASILAASFTTAATAQDIDWKKVDDTFGRKPAVSDDVHRYGFPRTDLTVTLDGVTIKPALALGGWVAFKPMHGEAMVMGDLVLLETEINPVMLKMIEGGLTAARLARHVLHARRRPRRSRKDGWCHSGCPGRKRDPARDPRGGATACRRSRHRTAGPDHRGQRTGERRCLSIRRVAA